MSVEPGSHHPPILMIGPFPPPVHGASLVTLRLAERLRVHMPVVCCDISPGAARGLSYHLTRAWRVLKAAYAVLASPQGATVYLSAAGGSGLVYTAFLAGVARLIGRRVVIHHHSFAYINQRSGLMALVAAFAGPRALHLALCQRMARSLRALYPRAMRTAVLSNAFMFAPVAARPGAEDGASLRLGHLSNLSREKGLYDVLALQEELQRHGARTELLLAGPTANAEDADRVASAIGRSAGRIRHLGPLYGKAKDDYFASIDAFLFPSRYVNEAEPLVVFEALAQGVPVIAYDRGCIAEQLGDGGGLVVPATASFMDSAAPLLADWAADRARLHQAQSGAQRCMASLADAAAAQFVDLLAQIAGPGVSMTEGR
jgi:glycosyltransferase involved in cell wall biosynthesis